MRGNIRVQYDYGRRVHARARYFALHRKSQIDVKDIWASRWFRLYYIGLASRRRRRKFP